MEFRHLRYFLVLAEELHFGRAAHRLSITQPPLSLNIQQLEGFVGTTLFVRNSKKVTLTDAGRSFVPRARALLEQATQATRYVRDVGEGITGRLQIGFVGAMLYQGLPQLLCQYKKKHPTMQVDVTELNSQEQLNELMHNRLDVGFVYSPRIPSELQHLPYRQEPFLGCLPNDHQLAQKGRINLQQLQNDSLIIFPRNVAPEYHEHILSIFYSAGIQPQLCHAGRHWLSIVSMVAQGLGVALVPASLQYSGLNNVVFLPLDNSSQMSSVQCVWKRDHQGLALASFLDTVRNLTSLP